MNNQKPNLSGKKVICIQGTDIYSGIIQYIDHEYVQLVCSRRLFLREEINNFTLTMLDNIAVNGVSPLEYKESIQMSNVALLRYIRGSCTIIECSDETYRNLLESASAIYP